METENAKRIAYLDTAKGIGILLVCIGHACTNKGSIAACQMADLIRFVTLFHMALFFFINGMLYRCEYSEKPVRGCVKKFCAYYLPFLKYNLFFWLFHNVFSRLHLISGALDAKDYPYVGIRAYTISLLKTMFGFRQRFAGGMWFLEALLVLSVVFIFVDFIITRLFPKNRIRLLTLAVFGIVLLNQIVKPTKIPMLPTSLTQIVYWGFNGLLFFYLGYLFRLYEGNRVLYRQRKWLVPVLFGIVCLAVVLMKPRIVSVITNTELSLLQYGCYALVCLCGIVMVILLSQFRLLEQSRLLKLLGICSLPIMCLHLLAFKPVSLLIVLWYRMPLEHLAEYPVIMEVEGLWWIAYTVCGCLLPVLAVKLWEAVRRRFLLWIRGRRQQG